MTPETKKLLKAAWRENRLVAIHIDLQNGYYDSNRQTPAAFHNTAPYAAALRRAGVPNIWVAFPARRNYPSRPILSVGELQDQMSVSRAPSDKLSPFIGADRDETVIAKMTPRALSADSRMVLDIHLDTLGKDTLLISGVLARACVSSTIYNGMLKRSYTIVAVGDCMDLTADETLEYPQKVAARCSEDLKLSKAKDISAFTPLQMATSADVAKTLREKLLRDDYIAAYPA